MLLLALSDQCGEASGAALRAQQLARGLQNEYERWYYSGLVAERRARAHLKRGGAATDGIYDWLMDALDCFERAERVRPAGNDDAILRWNTCVRVLQRHPQLRPSSEIEGRAFVSGIAVKSQAPNPKSQRTPNHQLPMRLDWELVGSRFGVGTCACWDLLRHRLPGAKLAASYGEVSP